MIRLTGSELIELGKLYALANTPPSLYHALAKNSSVRRMRTEMGPAVLAADFNRFSARDKRSEVSLGLAYATLVALLTHPERVEVPRTVERLKWGRAFVELAKSSGLVTSTRVIDALQYRVQTTTSPASPLILHPRQD